MAYSANKTNLFYSSSEKVRNNSDDIATIAAAIDTGIDFLMEVPEFGGTPEKIDVTTLKDSTKQYIPGIKDYGDLVFKFLYDNDANGNYRVLKGLDDNGTAAAFKIEYPDGTCHIFDAIPAVKMDAGAINGALTFSATMMLQSDIKMVEPADSNADE